LFPFYAVSDAGFDFDHEGVCGVERLLFLTLRTKHLGRVETQ
jgi:hypothetical protein